ncbi:DJ-1/PfpI family protein [Tychonema sp. LEGE 07199]|uniref:DJ-1/PfpI family protein n=1 Tax=unclassified Tychonema TaxID=2642144 RepID=UPI00187E6721|nr:MULTISPECIES: DJ-1/PfpI family protein [unclassified Tychonema]MBE9120112.1 DJ-1/PfpI family protein [Tychonema sp. LEGE 07199]MBE9132806.1 DJ-1/PfpI family protein [Tychonema sp. LEGE 07196]
MPPKNVAILMFDDVEVLDFAGPFEVFSVTSELNSESNKDSRPFAVYTVAQHPGAINARNGLSVNPDCTISNCPTPDILIVPGGKGTRKLIDNSAVINWIKDCSQTAELVLSVCTGSLLLAKAGLLEGLAATTHHRALDLLRKLAPNTTIIENQRFVDNGKIITSGGISAGIDMSLHVVGKLLGTAQAEKTAEHMEYKMGNW